MSSIAVMEDQTVATPDLLTVREFAKAVRMSPSTVLRAITDGELRAGRLTTRSPYRIPASELQRFLAEIEGSTATASADESAA